jgi:hypothetical protein
MVYIIVWTEAKSSPTTQLVRVPSNPSTRMGGTTSAQMLRMWLKFAISRAVVEG